MFGVPIGGTHAHSWVMSFPDELTAFRAYAEVFPENCLLLVDTYDTLSSGIPNAITVFNELRAKGYEPTGIRLDSGDLAFLSRQARKMLDAAGFPNAKIFASGDLDEEVIWDLKAQGAAINVWGVGTRMITSMDNPALGGVYKLSAEEINGKFEPRIKISENPAKITNPGVKRLYRFYDRLSGKALADLIALEEDDFSSGKPFEIFDPENTWKRMTLCDYEVRPLLAPIFENGELVYHLPTLPEIAQYARNEMDTFWDEYKRLHSPHRYKVDLSQNLYELKRACLKNAAKIVKLIIKPWITRSNLSAFVEIGGGQFLRFQTAKPLLCLDLCSKNALITAECPLTTALFIHLLLNVLIRMLWKRLSPCLPCAPEHSRRLLRH